MCMYYIFIYIHYDDSTLADGNNDNDANVYGIIIIRLSGTITIRFEQKKQSNVLFCFVFVLVVKFHCHSLGIYNIHLNVVQQHYTIYIYIYVSIYYNTPFSN